MKNYILLLLGLFLLVSCGDDETPAELILGKWTVDTYSIDSCPDAGINATTVTAENGCVIIFGEKQCLSFTFAADNMVSISAQFDEGDVQLFDADYTIDENGNIMICDEDNDCVDATLSEGIFTINAEEDNCPTRTTFKK